MNRLCATALLALIGIFVAFAADGATARFGWDPPMYDDTDGDCLPDTEPQPCTDLAGYRFYYKSGPNPTEPFDGIGALEGDSPIDIPLGDLGDPEAPLFRLNCLEQDTRYHVAVTATDVSGNESCRSSVVSILTPVAFAGGDAALIHRLP